MTPDEENSFVDWMLHEDLTSYHHYDIDKYNCLSFSLDLIQNATKKGYDKLYLATLVGQRYLPDGHAVIATKIGYHWHLWEPNFRDWNIPDANLTRVLQNSPEQTAVTILNPNDVARDISGLYEEQEIEKAEVARFILPAIFPQDFDF